MHLASLSLVLLVNCMIHAGILSPFILESSTLQSVIIMFLIARYLQLSTACDTGSTILKDHITLFKSFRIIKTSKHLCLPRCSIVIRLIGQSFLHLMTLFWFISLVFVIQRMVFHIAWITHMIFNTLWIHLSHLAHYVFSFQSLLQTCLHFLALIQHYGMS